MGEKPQKKKIKLIEKKCNWNPVIIIKHGENPLNCSLLCITFVCPHAAFHQFLTRTNCGVAEMSAGSVSFCCKMLNNIIPT